MRHYFHVLTCKIPQTCDFYLNFQLMLCFRWANIILSNVLRLQLRWRCLCVRAPVCVGVCVCEDTWFGLWQQTESTQLWPLELALITAFAQVGCRVLWSRSSCPWWYGAAFVIDSWRFQVDYVKGMTNPALNWILRDPKGDLCWER